MNQQCQDEQERGQRDQCPSWIEDHPDFVHVKSPIVYGTDKRRSRQADKDNRQSNGRLQPGTPCPCKDMSYQGNSGKTEEAAHENFMELLCLTVRKPR